MLMMIIDFDCYLLVQEQEDDRDHSDDLIENPDPHFDPIVNLPPVQTKTLEEDEEEIVKL